MAFELSNIYLEELKDAIGEENRAHVHSLIKELHPADIAEILHETNLVESQYLYKLLSEEDKETASEVLMELEEDVRIKFLSSFSSKDIVGHLDNLNSDDAADLIAELSDEVKDEVLREIKGTEAGIDIEDLLAYSEDTAGALMAKELIKVNLDWNVLRCVREMRRQAENVDSVYTVYVVDEENILHGILSLKRLLLTPDREKVSNIYFKDVISVKATASLEEVARLIEKYDLVVLPVVDNVGRLLGRITVDDVVDVIQDEAREDYQLLSGITQDVESDDTMWMNVRARIPWLLIAMLGGIVASQIVGLYEGSLEIHPELALFMPLIAAMGGNVGIQSSALVVQSLASNTVHRNIWLQISRELGIGLMNGLICAAVIIAFNLVFSHSVALGVTVGLSLITVITFAAMFGTFMPLMLNRFNFDPALATGPFITTSNDIIGLFFYFLIARLIYGMF